MKRRLVQFAAILAICVAALLSIFWSAAAAQGFRSGNHVVVGPDETVNSTLWTSGRTVDIAGRVNGDVFCAGQNVTVSGVIQGDLICTAQTIVVSGNIIGSLRLAGQNVTVSGQIGRNATVAAQSFTQETKSNLKGDASIGANDVTLNGSVGRDAAIGATSVTLGGKIGRNVKATVQDLSLLRSAHIAGNLEYASDTNAKIASGAVVDGKTTKTQPKAQPSRASKIMPIAFGFWSALYVLLAGLLAALIIVLFFPQAVHAVTTQAVRSPWKTLLVGFVTAFIVPALLLLLMLTIIGIPLALLLLLAWILIQALAGILSAYYLGRTVWRRQRNPVLIMLVGVVLLIVLYFIPIFGFIAFLLAMLMGTGMLLLELNRQRPKPRYRVE